MSYKNLAWFTIGNTPGTAGDFTVSAAVDELHVTLGPADDGKAFQVRALEAGVGSEVRTGCTYTHSGTTLSRGTLESSTSGSALDFTSAAQVQIIGATAVSAADVDLQLDRGTAIVGNAASTSQTFSAGAATKISAALDSVSQNSRGWWSVANKRYLPLEAGNYAVGVFYTLDSVAADKLLQAQIWKNGAVFARGDAITSGLGGTIAASTYWVVPCNGTTDYIEAYGYNGDSSPLSSTSSVGRVGFFAYRL